MRALHVAALPFPTSQGTQAAIASMMRSSARQGRDTHLLTYGGDGDGQPLTSDPAYSLHRAAVVSGRDSLRSGPALRKLAQDIALGRAARALGAALQPAVLVGHHVEGTAACLSAGIPTVFFAHTDLAGELPSYLPRMAEGPLHAAGVHIDRMLTTRCGAVAAISPLLQRRLTSMAPQRASHIHHVPVPWPVASPTAASERARWRAAIGIEPSSVVALYAGNLDAYQGVDTLVHAIALARRGMPELQLVVASDSDATSLRTMATAAGLGDGLRVHPLRGFGGEDGEHARRALHAVADIAVIPREAQGGLPIKMLDALSRGVPTVAVPAALAGVDYGAAVAIASGCDAAGLAVTLVDVLASSTRLQRLSEAGPRHIEAHHSDAAFLSALDACCAAATGA